MQLASAIRRSAFESPPAPRRSAEPTDPRSQREPLHLVDGVGIHAKRQVSVQPDRLDPAASYQPGQWVAGVDDRAGGPRHIKAQDLSGHEPLPAELLVQRPVGVAGLLQQPCPAAAGVAQRGF